MGRRVRLTVCLLVAMAGVVASACDRPREVEQRRELLKVPSAVEQAKQHREQTRLYDDTGALVPSDEVISGLRLPRGLKLQFKLERRWVYDTLVPLDRLRAYFGPRLETGSVAPGGGAVTYKHARAKESAGEIFFDVLIGAKVAEPGRNFVDIREYAPVPVTWPSDEEVRKKMAEAAARGE